MLARSVVEVDMLWQLAGETLTVRTGRLAQRKARLKGRSDGTNPV